jgi:ribosomal protein S26
VLAEINTVAAAFSDQLIEKSDYCRSCSSFKQLIKLRSIFIRRRKNSFHGYENSLGKWRDLKLCNLFTLAYFVR